MRKSNGLSRKLKKKLYIFTGFWRLIALRDTRTSRPDYYIWHFEHANIIKTEIDELKAKLAQIQDERDDYKSKAEKYEHKVSY